MFVASKDIVLIGADHKLNKNGTVVQVVSPRVCLLCFFTYKLNKTVNIINKFYCWFL